jgi:hypothetical protein
MVEKRHDEESKKGLNACVKLDRSFKKLLKCLESSQTDMKEKDRNENEKSIIHFVKKVGKRASLLKTLYPPFEFDSNQLEDITSTFIVNEESPHSSLQPGNPISPNKDLDSSIKKSLKSFMRTSSSAQSTK